MNLRGQIFETASARSSGAELSLRAGHLVLTCQDDGEVAEVQLTKVSDRLAGTARRLHLTDGRLFVTEDDKGADAILAALGRPAGFRVFILERPSVRNLALCLGLFVTIAGGLYFGLPVAADLAALGLPDRLERQAGGAAFENLDSWALEPSQLLTASQDRVRGLFEQTVRASKLSFVPELHFRASELLGANAFAFPGGPVVVTDALVTLAPNNDALVGVLAHEIAHIEARHGLRRLMRAVGWTIIVSTLIGDSSTVLDELVAFPVVLITQGYSRAFEIEADQRALVLMRQLDFDPKAYEEMLARLYAPCGTACDEAGWWSSHPGFENRIEALTPAE